MPVLANLGKFLQNLGKTDMPQQMQMTFCVVFALGFRYLCIK